MEKRSDSVQYNYQTPLGIPIAGMLEGHSWAFYAQQMPFSEVGGDGSCVGNWCRIEWWLTPSRFMDSAHFGFLVNEIDHSSSMLEFPMSPYSWEEVEAELAKDEPWFCFDGVMPSRLPKLYVRGDDLRGAVFFASQIIESIFASGVDRINDKLMQIGEIVARIAPPVVSAAPALTIGCVEGKCKFPDCYCFWPCKEIREGRRYASGEVAPPAVKAKSPAEKTEGSPKLCGSNGCLLPFGHTGDHTVLVNENGEFGPKCSICNQVLVDHRPTDQACPKLKPDGSWVYPVLWEPTKFTPLRKCSNCGKRALLCSGDLCNECLPF